MYRKVRYTGYPAKLGLVPGEFANLGLRLSQKNRDDIMDEKLAVEYFASYAKCYDTFDVVSLAKYYFAPTLMVKNGSVLALSTVEEIFEHLKSLLASYKEHGYKRGNLAGIVVNPMGAWSAAVTVHWIIDHVDGSVLRDFYTTYNLFREDGVWKILVTTNHEE